MPMQDKTFEQNFWDDCAKRGLYAAFDKEEYDDIFNRCITDFSDKVTIDIGCASGVSAALLASKGANVLGIDISPELIKQANELWKDFKGNLKFAVDDAEELKMPNNSADICFFGGVIHHFPDKNKTIEECGRVLKKGGYILAIEPNYDDYFQRLNWKKDRKWELTKYS